MTLRIKQRRRNGGYKANLGFTSLTYSSVYTTTYGTAVWGPGFAVGTTSPSIFSSLGTIAI